MTYLPRASFLLAALLGAVCAGCGPEVVRGSQEPGIDSAAMSTGLDRHDVQKLLSEALGNLRQAPIMDDWRQKGGRETVAVFPIKNDTSEHVGPMLEATLGEIETWLIDSQVVTVISHERQGQVIAEVEGQQGAAFNQSNVARYGKQLGARYYITGKIQSADERLDDQRRTQYTLFLQVIELETGAIRWQHKSYVSKLLR